MSPKPKPNQTPEGSTHFSFEAIGTRWRIELYGKILPGKAARIRTDIESRIAEFDKNYSRFRDDSLVSQISRSAGEFRLPDDAEPMFDLYQELEQLSGGVITPLIGRTLEEAGYDPEYSLKPGKLSSPPRWDKSVAYNFPKIRLKQPLLLDVGAAGKGYLVDIVGKLIESHEVAGYLIDAGGDIFYRNPAGRSLQIGLEDPSAGGRAIGVIALPSGMSVCGSAGNRRRWDRFTHIINPKTLSSPRDIEAIWVVANSCLLADAMATGLFFVPYNTLRKRYTFEYALLHKDYSLSHSPDFPATFFTPDEALS